MKTKNRSKRKANQRIEERSNITDKKENKNRLSLEKKYRRFNEMYML